MKCLRTFVRSLLVTLSIMASMHAVAGPYGDDMAKCLVKAASPDDQTVFIKWLFAAIALHCTQMLRQWRRYLLSSGMSSASVLGRCSKDSLPNRVVQRRSRRSAMKGPLQFNTPFKYSVKRLRETFLPTQASPWG
jgi:hypothetical protein